MVLGKLNIHMQKNETSPLPLHYKNFKWVTFENMKKLEENKREMVQNTATDKVLLHKTPKTQ
jgi:hypothetical protein